MSRCTPVKELPRQSRDDLALTHDTGSSHARVSVCPPPPTRLNTATCRGLYPLQSYLHAMTLVQREKEAWSGKGDVMTREGNSSVPRPTLTSERKKMVEVGELQWKKGVRKRPDGNRLERKTGAQNCTPALRLRTMFAPTSRCEICDAVKGGL